MQLTRRTPIIRSTDVDALGAPRTVLSRLVEDGRLIRVARGVYRAADADLPPHHSLAEAQVRVPRGVVCLLSALSFHELTTQLPHEVWLAIAGKARKPAADTPPLRIVRFSARALTEGVAVHRIAGVDVHITTPARTVADCFKYRNKIGIDVAVEALRDYSRKRAGTMDDLWRAAKLDRVHRVMQAYLESLE